VKTLLIIVFVCAVIVAFVELLAMLNIRK